MTGLTIAVLLFATTSAAPSVQQCVSASTEAQREQKSGNLLSARRQLEVCSHPDCPAVVQSDCTKWLAEVLAATPTLVVVARLDGVDQRQARVLLDGHLWLGELSGRPEDVEPGQRELTVTVGAQTRVQKLLVNVGEKNRLIVFEFSTALTDTGDVPPAPPGPSVTGRRFPVLALVLSTVALAGVGAFTALGLSGRASLDTLLKQDCAGTKSCDPRLVADVQRRFLFADLSLGAGVLSAGLAIWQWLAWAMD
ncbi:MAG: hypothetical protein JNJ54_30290 [Myxococcaceae bacterium]|nr:hypothetical protein [Myxococcaceae bacterium]